MQSKLKLRRAKKAFRKPSAAVFKALRNSASTNEHRVFIIPNMSRWSVKTEGSTKAYRIVDSKEQALRIAKKIVQDGQGTSIVKYNRDGSFSKVAV